MSPAQPAVVTDAEVEAAAKAMFELRPAYMSTGPDAERWTWEKASSDSQTYHRENARAALNAAVRSDDFTTRLTEAADRVAKAEERAEKAEALAAARFDLTVSLAAELDPLQKEFQLWKAERKAAVVRIAELAAGQRGWYEEYLVMQAQVADLTGKLDEARGVLRTPEIEWAAADIHGAPHSCVFCGGFRKMRSHDPGCALAAVLAPETEKETP